MSRFSNYLSGILENVYDSTGNARWQNPIRETAPVDTSLERDSAEAINAIRATPAERTGGYQQQERQFYDDVDVSYGGQEEAAAPLVQQVGGQDVMPMAQRETAVQAGLASSLGVTAPERAAGPVNWDMLAGPGQFDGSVPMPSASVTHRNQPSQQEESVLQEQGSAWTDVDASLLPVSSEHEPVVDEFELMMREDMDKDVEKDREIRKEQRIARKAARNAGKVSSYDEARSAAEEPTTKVDTKGFYNARLREIEENQYSERNTRVYNQAVKQTQNELKQQRSHNDVGARIWGKILSDSTLRFNEVGVGVSEIMAILEQNPAYIDEILKGLFPDGTSGYDVSYIADVVNAAADRHDGTEIHVGVNKPPDNNISDQQDMVLRIMTNHPRGIFFNPLVANLFTADFDGDDANTSLDPIMPKLYRGTMDLMIDPDGTTHVNPAWFTTEHIVGNLMGSEGKEDFVRNVMLDGIDVNAAIVNRVIELANNDDPKNKGLLLKMLMIEIRKYVNEDNARFEEILHEIYTSFQRMKRYVIADTIGTYVDVPVEPRTDSDQILINFVNDVVVGKIPANWLDFSSAFNSFIGDVAGENSNFRVSGSVGKRFKLDTRIYIGGEYNIDLNNKKQVETFLQATFEYAMAERMSHEFKRNGRSYAYSQEVKRNVIARVGYPDTKKKDGTPLYGSTAEWLQRFCKVYHQESSFVNEANLVIRANMQISQSSNRSVVATIDPSGRRNNKPFITYGDVADALVQVYEDNTLERMFRNLYWKDRQPNLKEGWTEREIWQGNYTRPDKSVARGWVANQRYKSYSVRRFSKDNHVVLSGNEQERMKQCIIPVWDKNEGTWRTERYDSQKKEIVTRYGNVSDNIVEMNLMLAIADQKTSSESAYSTRVYGFVDKSGMVRPEYSHSKGWQNDQQRRNERTNKYYDDSGKHKTLMQIRLELLQDIVKAKRRDNHDTYIAMGDIIRLVTASGPELFSYFGLDTVNGWEKSKYAKAMMDAVDSKDSLDILGGLNMTMHYVMRTDEIFADMNRIKVYRDAPGMSLLEGQTMNKVALMQQELASSSQTWRAIVMEQKLGTAWTELPELARKVANEREQHKDDKNYHPSVYIEASEYWMRDPSMRHGSIDELMRDGKIGFVDKRNILCDLVRFHTGDSLFRSYEVCMQLEVGSSGVWKLDSNSGQQLFETYNNLERLFNQYGDTSYQNMMKNIEDAYEKYGEHQGSLMGAINTLATHPGMMCKVAFETMADSVCAVMDRLYDQTEKAKSHPWSNEAYQGLSISHNGGYYNEIYRTDDLVVGGQHLKQVMARDLIQVLNDPKFFLTGYNNYGRIVRINRDQLLGFDIGESYDVEQEVWRFLRENPRIAGCLRMQEVAVSASMDAKAYAVAACDTTETIARCFGENGEALHSPIDDVAYLMFDHPVFHGIASLVTPAYGTKASHRSPMIAETERYLCWLIYRNSSSDDRVASRNAERILRMIGVTMSSLKDAMTSDFDIELANVGVKSHALNDAERDMIATQMYRDCLKYMRNYLMEVANDPSIDHRDTAIGVNPPILGIDKGSAQSFYDVIQELSGAKTQVSTGIEGYETFQYAEWAQLIDAKDHYTEVDLIREELEDDPELAQTFNGAMTNAMSGDEILTLNIEDGIITNYDELVSALKGNKETKHDKLIVLCPETYQVKDRTIDSKGRNIPTLRSYMMNKRSLGAEKHNLQAMKTGIDGTDSITKIKSKYFDNSGDHYNRLIGDVRSAASKGATEDEKLFLAKLHLSRMLLKANTDIGYDTDTLSNYMCLADLMVVMGDDGEIYVRSLAQLFTALKYLIGAPGKDMSLEQRREIAMMVVNDRSETGCIGRAVGDLSEAFDYLRPSRVSPSIRGVYPYLSNQSVNKRMLEQLSDSTGHMIWSTTRRESTEKKLRGRHKWLNKVLKSTFILRQYHVIACIDSKRWDDTKEHDIGMSSLVVIGEDLFTGKNPISTQKLSGICNRCWQHGNTILIPAVAIDENVLDPRYAGDAMVVATDENKNPEWYIINTFHMRLNGAEASPYQATFAMAQVPYEKDVYTVEDSFGEFDYGDSVGKIVKGFLKRCGISHQPKSVEVRAQDLFAQQFDMLGKHDNMEVSFVDQETLDAVLNGNDIGVEIDYGIPKGSKDFDRRKRDVDAAIARYMEKTDNGDGLILNQDCAAGDIVGWALAKVHKDGIAPRYVIAPIIPLPLHGVKRGMERFKCIHIDYKDGDKGIFAIDMVNSAPFDGYTKAFLPSGGADKVMIDLSSPIDDKPRTLMDGTEVDIYVDARTTSSRRVGTMNRLRTMETLIRVARRNGYNFARLDNAFPDAATNETIAQIKEGLKYYPPPGAEFWKTWVDVIRFHTDSQIDAFVRYNCKKILRNGGNPSHFLASEFIDPNIDPDNPINSMMQWEYIPSFENGLNYEDAFLKFFAELNPHGRFNGRFCPNGIDDNSNGCLFRLMQDNDGNIADGFNRGVLQMQVPHRFMDYDSENRKFATERWVYTWECVFAGMGFFGEDFSSGSRPNIEGASRMSDVLNTIGYSVDVDIPKEESRLKYAWMTADLGGDDISMTGNNVSLWR